MGGETVNVPAYNPGDVANNALRVTDGNGNVYAFKLVEPNATSDHALRVADGNGTIRAISTTSANVIEGFEDGQWPDDWVDETGKATLTTNALKGSYSLEFTSDATPNMGKQYTTNRGYTYSCRVVAPGSGSEPQMLVNSQWSSSPHTRYNAYSAWLDLPDNDLYVVKWSSNTTNIIAKTDVALYANTEYVLAMDVDTDRLQAHVYDANRNHIASTGWASDSQFTGGILAVSASGSPMNGIRFDDFQRHPLGTI